MTPEQYRKLWLKLHRSYEKKAFAIFNRSIRKTVKDIPFNKMTKHNYVPYVEFYISEQVIQKAFYDMYLQIGLLHGNRITRSIVKDSKSLETDLFQAAYKNNLLQWLKDNAGTRITTVRGSLVKYLIDEINKGVKEGRDVESIAKEIQKLVRSRSFYRWQALRIARTETTTAANYAATVSSTSSRYVMEKIWISSNDARTRQIEKGDKHDHIDMHLVAVGEKEAFDVQGDFMLYPGDPNGQPSNTINCRCTIGIKPKRDKNNRLIRK